MSERKPLLSEVIQMIFDAKSLHQLRADIQTRFQIHRCNPPYHTMNEETKSALLTIADAAKAMFKCEECHKYVGKCPYCHSVRPPPEKGSP